MKFFVDANLPLKLVKALIEMEYDVVHTENLPNKDFTKDAEIRSICKLENRVLITKDSDFLDSHLLRGTPSKLILVTTGNIKNMDLIEIFRKNFSQILELLLVHDLIEVGNENLLSHEK